MRRLTVSDSFPANLSRRLVEITPKARNGIAVVVFAGVAALGVALLFSDTAPVRWRLAAPMLWIIGLALAALVRGGKVRDREVEYDEHALTLRFGKNPCGALPVLLAVPLLISPLLVEAFLFDQPVDRWTQRMSYALVVAGVVLAVLFTRIGLTGLTNPEGLTLSEHGLSGVRGSRRVDHAWDEIEAARAEFDRGWRLVIHPREGRAIEVDQTMTDSDPRVVAAIIVYYKNHPEERGLLASPKDAIHRVWDSGKGLPAN